MTVIPSRHTDAIGYVNDLAKEVGEPWFNMICELATVSGMSTLDRPAIDTIYALYTKRASFLGIKSPGGPGVATPILPSDYLEEVSGFTNFKLLGDSLCVTLKKPITLIFGANGSGKSSLCESLKVLATSEKSSRPLENVRTAGTTAPTFRFKFKSDSVAQIWTQASGFGFRKDTVKYFDNWIAIKSIKNPMNPGRVIVLTPFKLHVFEWVKALTDQFRGVLQQDQKDNSVSLVRALEIIRREFVLFTARPLSAIDEKTLNSLGSQIQIGEAFAEHVLLKEKQTSVVELEKATSEEGLKLLKAEHRELEAFINSISTLIKATDSMWALEPVLKARTLASKQAEQKILAETILPKNGTLETLLELIRSAALSCSLEAADGHACPLCRRDLGNSEIGLFKKYYELLEGALEKEIVSLKEDISNAQNLASSVLKTNREEWEKSTTLHADVLSDGKRYSDLILNNCDITKEVSAEAKTALESLRTSSIVWTKQLAQKALVIETATKSRDDLIKQLASARTELESLEYGHAVFSNVDKLKEAKRMADEATAWSAALPAFVSLLRKITDAAKKAHENLVVADFEARLNAEYKLLTERDMAAFGVKLAKKGTDASVVVLPQIGGKEIESVLSEGEQRIHALALFFAELETCQQSVLIFDDPISSFDYNYIANYCIRLRDFTVTHPNRQIIMLTHNWEFFVQLQTILNAAGKNGHLSVQVLESCTAIADYSEKTSELKKDIDLTLAISGEPTKPQKEAMAGRLRRLIEAVVNTHVFNEQRHQYKQKSQPVSDFHKFTKLVALLPTEATTLKDLYAKLSVSEHDDPRNAYVNTDRATFQARYDSILAIETAVEGRK